MAAGGEVARQHGGNDDAALVQQPAQLSPPGADRLAAQAELRRALGEEGPGSTGARDVMPRSLGPVRNLGGGVVGIPREADERHGETGGAAGREAHEGAAVAVEAPA